MTRPAGSRWLAGGAAVLVAVGGVLVVVAVAGLPHPWTHGYVSEAGVAPYQGAGIYRFGILGLSLGLLLLGTAVARLRIAVAALLLLPAGLLGGVSASVSCSPGCPLPPYEPTHAVDLVHAGASTFAIGLTALAMLALAGTRIEKWGRIGFLITAPVLAALAICLLAIGRSATTAILERLVLVEIFGWLVVAALMLTCNGRSAGATLRPGHGKAETP